MISAKLVTLSEVTDLFPMAQDIHKLSGPREREYRALAIPHAHFCYLLEIV